MQHARLEIRRDMNRFNDPIENAVDGYIAGMKRAGWGARLFLVFATVMTPVTLPHVLREIAAVFLTK